MPRFWSPGQALFTRARLHLSCLDGKIPGSCAIEMDSSTWEKHFEFENPCDRFFFKLWNRFFLQRYFPGWYLVIGLILEKVYIMFQEWEKFHPKTTAKESPRGAKSQRGWCFIASFIAVKDFCRLIVFEGGDTEIKYRDCQITLSYLVYLKCIR